MNDEKWLRDLARVEIEEREDEAVRLDERWDRLSRGELSAEEEAELRALAAESEEAAEAYELFRPFSAETQARMLAELSKQDPRILPFRQRAVRVAGWLSAAAAAAAAVLVVLQRPPSGPFPVYADAHLEGYQLPERGSEQAAPEIPVYGPGSELSLTLTPRESRVRQVRADCYFVRTAGAVPCPEGILRVFPDIGTVEVKGTVGKQIRLPPGDVDLCVIAGFKGRLPAARTAACEAGAAKTPPEAGYWVIRKPLRIVASNA